MSDKYIDLVNGGPLTGVAKQLGLPQPPVLRRYEAGQPLLENNIVLLVGDGPDLPKVTDILTGWGLDVRTGVAPDQKVGAIVAVFTDITRPQQFQEPVLEMNKSFKRLAKNGRFVTLSRPFGEHIDDPATNSARAGVEGLVRSLGQEVRGGATANGILINDDVAADAVGVQAALRFFLSSRSAFVDGQFLVVDSERGELPENWEKPLAGQVAAVTGAARGIGKAIAETLHNDGAEVIVIDVPAAGENLAKVANALGGLALQQDITAEDAGAKIAEAAQRKYGRLDIVVHNAGITRDKLFANMDDAKWGSVIAVNIESQLKMNEQLLASPVFQDHPRIISMSSTSGIAGNRGQTNYAVTKAGVIGMVQATTKQAAEFGGTANAIAPGFIETEMTAAIPFATRNVARRLNSLLQGGLPEDVAQGVAFFASPAAEGLSGQVLRVCGQNKVGK